MTFSHTYDWNIEKHLGNISHCNCRGVTRNYSHTKKKFVSFFFPFCSTHKNTIYLLTSNTKNNNILFDIPFFVFVLGSVFVLCILIEIKNVYLLNKHLFCQMFKLCSIKLMAFLSISCVRGKNEYHIITFHRNKHVENLPNQQTDRQTTKK